MIIWFRRRVREIPMSVRCSGMSFPQIAGIHVDLIKAKWIPAFAGMTPCDFSRYPEESHGYWAFRHARPRVRLDGPPGLPVTKRHRRPLATLKCNHRGDLIFQSWPISEFALSQSARSAQFYEGDVSFHTTPTGRLLCHFHRAYFERHTKLRPNRAEYRGEIIHARITSGRQHSMQTLAWFIGKFGQTFETKSSVHQVAKDQARGFWIVA